MEQKNVARRRNPNLSRLEAKLRELDARVPEDLFLPSLRERSPRVHGHAFRYFLVLPLYSADGSPVFTDELIGRLHVLFNLRFGGSLAPSTRSGPPYVGEYLPAGTEPIRDYHTTIIIYANPIEPSNRFFQELKSILRRAPLIRQDEILIERLEVYLV
jgi:hypothetical protein